MWRHLVLTLALVPVIPPDGAAEEWPAHPPLIDPVARRAQEHHAGPTLDMQLEADPAAIFTSRSMCATTRAHADYDGELRARMRAAATVPGTPHNARPLPSAYVQNGIFVIEDNGTVLNHDNIFDLAGRTIRFTPAGPGFAIAEEPFTLDPDPGALVIDQQQSFVSYQHSLSFSFPFGGASYAELWVSTDLGIRFAPPTAPGASQLLRANVLFDRTPRIGPMIMGASLRGYSVYLREAVDRVVVTWRTGNVDVQTVLFASGDIVMSWSRFDFEWGAPAVITGNAGFWSDEVAVGSGTDPVDVVLGTPEDAALDVTFAELTQVAGRDIFFLELTLAGAVPVTGALLYWDVALVRYPGDPSPPTYYLYYQNGAVSYTNASSVEVVGNTIRLGVGVDATEPPVSLGINTWHNNGAWQYADGAGVPVVSIPSIEPVMLDLSRDLPTTTDGPAFEAFTLPELNPYEVERVMHAYLGDLMPDGVPIYQNLYTDLIFYAGGYSTVGNAGADGIGVGNSTDPVTPAILHMDRLGNGWNWSRGGRLMLLNQEFGHHWLYFARIDDGGVPSTIVNPDGAHYAGWVHTPAALPVMAADDSSSLGGSYWTEQGGGRFTSSPAFSNFAYNWVDLYLLGLADPAEVDVNGDWWYIGNPVPSPPSAYWPPDGMVVDSGARVDLSIQQIIDNHGPRFPAYPATRRDMRVPFVLVGRPGQVSAADVDTLRGYCDDWVIDWGISTYNRSTVVCADAWNQAPDGIIVTPPVATTIVEGDALSFTGDWVDPDGDPVTWLWNFDGVAPDAAVQNPGPVTFPTAGVYDVCLTVADQPGGLVDPVPPCVEVTVSCAPPASLGNTLFLAKDDSATVHAYWSNQPGAGDYPLFASASRSGPFASEVVAGTDGAAGQPFAMPTETRLYYRLAARIGTCLGDLD